MTSNIFIRPVAAVAALVGAALFMLAAPPALAEERPKTEVQVAQVAAENPSAPAEARAEAAPSIAQAQTSAPAGGDGRLATLGDISGLRTDFGAEMRAFRAEMREQRAENERRWSELRSDLSSFKNTVIILLGGILATLLWPWVSRLWERRNSSGKEIAQAGMVAFLAVSLLASPLVWAETATPPVSQWVTECKVDEMDDETFCRTQVKDTRNKFTSTLGYGCAGDGDEGLSFQFDYLNLDNAEIGAHGYRYAMAKVRWGKEAAKWRNLQVHDNWLDYTLRPKNPRIKRLATEKFGPGYLLRLQLSYYKAGSPVFKYPLFGSAEAIAKARAGCGICVDADKNPVPC